MPEIAGAAVLAGPEATVIVAVTGELAVVIPETFEALTCTRTVEPTLADEIVCVLDVAPEIAAQLPPALLQRSHV